MSFSGETQLFAWFSFVLAIFAGFLCVVYLHVLCWSDANFKTFSLFYTITFGIRFLLNILFMSQEFQTKFNKIEDITNLQFGMVWLILGIFEIIFLFCIIFIDQGL